MYVLRPPAIRLIGSLPTRTLATGAIRVKGIDSFPSQGIVTLTCTGVRRSRCPSGVRATEKERQREREKETNEISSDWSVQFCSRALELCRSMCRAIDTIAPAHHSGGRYVTD